MYKAFEVSNYAKGSTVARIVLEDGQWTADTDLGNSLVATVHRLFNDDGDRIDYLSRWTNQVLASRLVEDEE